jgi:hypothetical protein
MAYFQPAAEFVTAFACGVFAGAAVYNMECPRIVSTDLNGLMCKMFEEACLECVQPSSRPSAPLVQRHPPDRAHQLDGYER